MFFVGTSGGPGRGLLAALLLTGVILLGVFLTFGVSRLLSGTLLRGLPPYRRPRIGQVVVRSVLDRTLFVLGRAAAVAAPAGLLIWLCANVQVGGDSILNWCTGFLDPFARLLGLDGVILMAFLLGFPANEIVIPIIIMAYLSTGSLLDYSHQHNALFSDALALLHHLPDHRQGDEKRQVDPALHRHPHRHRHGGLLPGGLRRPPAGPGMRVKEILTVHRWKRMLF